MSDIADLLRHTAEQSIAYLDGVADRPVGRPIAAETLRAALGDGPLPARGAGPAAVVDGLVAVADPGLVASAGPRYFGFVVGGSLPAALAADWLTSAWDQNAFSYVSSPAASVIEEIAGRWVLEALGLPPDASCGFTTGATTSNMVGLAAARHAVLERAGWDVEARGLIGAPPIRILAGDEVHASALQALRFVGLGSDTIERIPVDGQGAIRVDAAEAMLAGTMGPAIVLAQAGNVNTGAVDPLCPIVVAAHAVGAWVHVDGAFGLWAAASPAYRHLLDGIERADSWAMDCHKWLNVPYDCGFVAVADRAAHYAATRMTGAYLVPAADRDLDPFDWVPEASRRGRATTVYAALRSLGREGVADLVERCCALARRMADRVVGEPGITILNDVVLNQVLVRFGDDDERTRAIIAAVQEDGTCWAGGTTWHGVAAMRLSVSSWATTAEDIDRSADAIIRCFRNAG
ncbi:MAG TPA: aminotransferase class V-fold PLP-dependent enzyme [Candidatus Limnocylindrales bacterium]|nr:aminotransferase class V-fold PLP-dependent enzyme [Candidatus Limnocylindrales bacterium]